MVMLFTLLLMGVGLSMDAFAVSICKGLSMRKVNKKQCLVIGLFFGGFQALMPFIGWVLGSQFEQYITSIDHWIAFILLGFIGGKMVVEAIREKDEAVEVGEMDPAKRSKKRKAKRCPRHWISKRCLFWQSQPASMPLPLESHLHFCRCQSLRQFPSSGLRPL